MLHPDIDKPEFWAQINRAVVASLHWREARSKGASLPLVDPHDLLPPGVHSFVDAYRIRREKQRLDLVRSIAARAASQLPPEAKSGLSGCV